MTFKTLKCVSSTGTYYFQMYEDSTDMICVISTNEKDYHVGMKLGRAEFVLLNMNGEFIEVYELK